MGRKATQTRHVYNKYTWCRQYKARERERDRQTEANVSVCETFCLRPTNRIKAHCAATRSTCMYVWCMSKMGVDYFFFTRMKLKGYFVTKFKVPLVLELNSRPSTQAYICFLVRLETQS